MKGIIYDVQYDDLRITMNNWLIHEINCQSKIGGDVSKTKAHSTGLRKTEDKILCSLTVDQLQSYAERRISQKLLRLHLSLLFFRPYPLLFDPASRRNFAQ